MQVHKVLKVFSISLLFTALFIFFANQRFSRSQIETVSFTDRIFFLKQLRNLVRSDFGFTLLGIKPLSFDDFGDYELNKDLKRKQKFIRWLQLLFHNSPRFTLRFFEEGEYCSAFLIDRKAFEQLHEDPEGIFEFGTEKIGVLFGYGEENAHFFLRSVELSSYFKRSSIISKRLNLFNPFMKR